MTATLAEVRHSARRLLASSGYSLGVLLTLTLGMGLSVGMYTVLNGLLQRLQEAVWAVDPQEAVSRVYRLEDDLEAKLGQVIFFTRVLGGFALLAVLLAGFGTYSVIAFLQRRQVREIGVRLALGAQPARVARHVLAQGVALAVIAGVAGSVAAVAVLRLLDSQLFGVGAGNPLLYLLGFAGVLLAALLASAAPAWRASRV